MFWLIEWVGPPTTAKEYCDALVDKVGYIVLRLGKASNGDIIYFKQEHIQLSVTRLATADEITAVFSVKETLGWPNGDYVKGMSSYICLPHSGLGGVSTGSTQPVVEELPAYDEELVRRLLEPVQEPTAA